MVVIQLLPNPADGPAVAGVTSVELRGNRFHPAVVQVRPGQTVTWSFDDNGTVHNVKGTGWGSGDPASGTFRYAFTAPWQRRPAGWASSEAQMAGRQRRPPAAGAPMPAMTPVGWVLCDGSSTSPAVGDDTTGAVRPRCSPAQGKRRKMAAEEEEAQEPP